MLLMTISNLQNLFSISYPTVQNNADSKIIGPVTLPMKIGNLAKSNMQTYLYSAKNEKYLVCLFGDIRNADNVLVRVSSACVFGFTLNSLLCDCKNQFEEAVERMVTTGPGMLIFGLDQHGKGIGLEAHFLVYAEGQRRQRGLFTEIYEDLGLEHDYRDYSEVMDIIKFFKNEYTFNHITMFTEAPHKKEYFSEKCKEAGISLSFDRFNTHVTEENNAELTEKVSIGYDIQNFIQASQQ